MIPLLNRLNGDYDTIVEYIRVDNNRPFAFILQ